MAPVISHLSLLYSTVFSYLLCYIDSQPQQTGSSAVFVFH